MLGQRHSCRQRTGRSWNHAELLGSDEQALWNLLPGEIPILAEARVPPWPSVQNGRQVVSSPCHFGCLPRKPLCCGSRVNWAGHIFLDMDGTEGTRVDFDFRECPQIKSEHRETYILPGRRWAHLEAEWRTV